MRRLLPERVRARLREVVGADQPAERLAAAWATGVAVGLSPLIGLHTAIALLLAVTFRLNKLDVLLGTLVINPWTLPPYFATSVVLGSYLTDLSVPRIVVPSPANLIDLDFWRQQSDWLVPLLTTWSVGASVFALIGALATFLGARAVILRHRAHHAADRARRGPG